MRTSTTLTRLALWWARSRLSSSWQGQRGEAGQRLSSQAIASGWRWSKESTLLAGLSRRSSSLLASTTYLPGTRRRISHETGQSQSATTAGRTNELGVEWLKHFIKHTEGKVVGARRLLILDGHESHHSLEFQELCKENNIYTLCMPPHSSHLLQPLDVGCFSPLKRAYSREIEALIRHHINHITKLEFLPAFKAAFERSFTSTNICSAFRGAGLVPLQPDVVLSKLDVQLRTPTPAALPEALWEAKTPSNVRELEAQSTLIRDRVRRHKSSSPASIIEAIGQLKKGAEVMMLSAELMRDRITSLERANEAATKRRQRKKKRIQKQGTLTKGEGEDILAQREADQQIEREQRQGGERSGLSRQALARCKRCRETGHNSRTCKKDILDTA